MKLTKLLFLAVLTISMMTSTALADSPITSTKFADAYMDEPIVVAAVKANGVITNELMDYLSGQYNPIDVKMAVINKIGWKISGRNNSELFMQYLMDERGYSSEKRFLKKGTADELLSMAYLKAMDNYFEVDNALKFAQKAVKKNRRSRTFQLIYGLIRAQKAMDSNWCGVYQITDGIRKNGALMNDMRTRAVGIIYKYMDIYGESCEKAK